MWLPCFSATFHPMVIFVWIRYYNGDFKMVIFLFLSFLLHLLAAIHLFKKKLPLYPTLIKKIFGNNMDLWILRNSVSYHPFMFLFIMVLIWSEIWPVTVLHAGLSVLLRQPHHFLKMSFLFGGRHSRLTLYFFCLNPGISHFSKET